MGQHIGYCDETLNDYGKALDDAKSLHDLRSVVAAYRRFADDAHGIVSQMEDGEWQTFKKGLRLERKGKFAGDDWAKKYGAVLMPEIMLHIGLIALQFKVPWGCAFIRAKESGMISESDGIVTVKEKHA